MASADLQNAAFTDDEKAREALEAVRWPNGPVCAHCGNLDQQKIARAEGKAGRPGLYYCAACNGQFTVTVGTVMERSHIPLSKWLLAMHLMASSKKGMSALQMSRMLGVTYKSAWFMAHRIREAMRPEFAPTMGGNGGTVEMDTTYVGGREKNRHAKKRKNVGRGGAGKEPVLALVERGGKVHSHHVPSVTAENVGAILEQQLHDDATLYTDDDRTFRTVKPRQAVFLRSASSQAISSCRPRRLHARRYGED